MGNKRPFPDIASILNRTPVLMYHKIDPRMEVGINALSPPQFQEQMRYLQQEGYQTITFQDLLFAGEIPAKPVMITFDDAYESVYENALPVMKQYQQRGVVYVIGEFIGKLNEWDANFAGIKFRHMSEAQLVEVANMGWELGAHTMTHRALSWIDEYHLKSEILQSRQVLTSLSEKPIVSLAYPFGMQNGKVRKFAEEAGIVFGCKGMRKRPETLDLLQLPRIPVYQFESLSAFRRKLQLPMPPAWERWKLTTLSSPAILTPMFQYFFRRQLFLDHSP